MPWLFAPVPIGGREYVDGGVWSPTNLDAAPAGRDTHVLCLNPTASIASTESVLALMRQVARTAVSLEALALRRRGAAVQLVAPNLELRGGDGDELHGPRAAPASARRGLPTGPGGWDDDARRRYGFEPPPALAAVASSASAATLRRRTAFDSART